MAAVVSTRILRLQAVSPRTQNINLPPTYIVPNANLAQITDASKIADGLISETKLASLAVTAAKIANGTIDLGGAKITGLLANTNLSQITDATKIADGLIGNTKLAALAVDAAKLASSAVESTKIASAAVGTAAIATAAITTALIASAAVGSAQIASAAITSALIGSAAVGTAAIASAAITTATIADLNVTTLKVAASSMTVPSSTTAGTQTGVTNDWTTVMSLSVTNSNNDRSATVLITYSGVQGFSSGIRASQVNIGDGTSTLATSGFITGDYYLTPVLVAIDTIGNGATKTYYVYWWTQDNTQALDNNVLTVSMVKR